MQLVIAEKPSVAQSIAKVIGAYKREDGYLEGSGYIVSWCVGHLVELAQPDAGSIWAWKYLDHNGEMSLHRIRGSVPAIWEFGRRIRCRRISFWVLSCLFILSSVFLILL